MAVETKKEQIPSVYSVLSSLDTKAIEQKKGTRADSPKFISWASAWDATKKNFPAASYKVLKPVENYGSQGVVHMSGSNKNYFTDGCTAWVEVEITIKGNVDGQVGEHHVVSLPIMNYKNDPIPLDKINSFDVNNTHMRALTKGLALCGLGIQMWIKDDVLAKLESGEHTSAKDAESNAAPQSKKAPSKAPVQKSAPAKEPPVNANKPVSVKKELMVLTDTHADFEKVLDYVATNAFKGIDQLVTDLSQRYSISEGVKAVLTETIEESGK